MGQIFISAGHGGGPNFSADPGFVVGSTTEAVEMMRIRDLVVPELRSRGFEVLAVPDDLTEEQSLAWINARCRITDVALELHAGAASNPLTRGASVFYIANNEARKTHGELLLLALLRRVPQLTSRGARPDTSTAIGTLPFTRQISCPSLLMEVGYLSNPDDLGILQNRRRDVALGIADGVASWSRAVAGSETATLQTFPEVNISVNGGLYREKGVIISDNAYIPIDLVDQLNIDLTTAADVRRVRYRNVVYVKAIDLRNYNISIGWEASTRTVTLRSQTLLNGCQGTLEHIMGRGNTSDVQLLMFLRVNNESAPERYKDLPRFYREEAAIEGVNHDIAFCQMCVETAFLRFGGAITPESNNFGGIGATPGTPGGASFRDARIGVRAHIQHLKAYASTEPLTQELVNPRFAFVRRGIAPLVGQLSGRWDADPLYGDRILAVLRRLYEASNLL